MSGPILRAEREGSRLVITLDDPATRNAMTDRLVTDLIAALALAEADPGIGAVVLRGVDGLFCAGADLKMLLASLATQAPPGEPDPIAQSNRRGGTLFARLYRHPAPVVAFVDGPAFGGGFGLACCADIVICGPRARFALSETSLGLPPAQIAPYVVRRLGLRVAKRLALTGMRFDGAEAVRLGFADDCADSVEAAEAILSRVLAQIGQCGPQANAATKRLMQDAAERAPDTMLDAAAVAFAACLRGAEGREGVASFAEKRRPAWAEQA